MAFDIANWVKGLKLPEAEQAAVLAAIGKGGKDALEFLEGNQLRQDEFSRKMNAEQKRIEALEKDLSTKMAQEDRFHTELSTWKTGSEKKYNDAVEARKKAEDALQAARDKVKTIQEEFEVPQDRINQLFEGVPARASNDTPPARSHEDNLKELDGRYVTREMFQAEARAYARLSALTPTLTMQHLRLFGQDAELPDWDKLIEDTITAKGAKTLQQVYEDHYKIADKRKELADKDIENRIATARKEAADAERAKILADNPTLGTTVRTGEREGSPILNLARRQAAEDAAKRVNQPTAIVSPVQAAVQAFNEGKYKNGKAA